MADERVIIELELDDGSVKKGFASINKGGKEAGRNLEKNLSSGLGGLKTKLLGIAAAAGAAIFSKQSIEAAIRQQDAVNELNTALALTGKFSSAASQDIQNFASELQRTTTIGDEATLETAALIQSLGNLSTEGLKEATTAAADLSAALGIDLNAAALLVGKAAAGEVSSFSRYGLVIKKGADNADTFAKALGAINEKFGGAAASKVLTFSGAITQAGNAFGDLQETIGDLVVKSPTVVALVGKIGGMFAKAGDGVKEFGKSGDVVGMMILQIIKFGEAVNTFVLVPLELASNLVKIAFNGIVTNINFAVNRVAEAGAKLISFFAPDSELAQTLNTFAESSRQVLSDSFADTSDAVEGVFDFDFTAKSAEFLESLRLTTEEAINSNASIEDSFNKMNQTAGSSLAGIAEKGKQTTLDLNKSLGAGIASITQEFVNAAIKGGNAFEALGKAVLGVFGDMAIQLGQFFIVNGIAVEALKFLSGSGAVAAGIALVALGTVLKGLSGGKGSVGGAAPDTAGGAVGGGGVITEPSIAESPAGEDLERGTAVTVNVEGAVLDPIGVGQSIVGILQETFDTTGSQVVTNVG